MDYYIQQAEDFLTECDASIDIRLIGKMTNSDWKEKDLRNAYAVTITTPRGHMSFTFWDSIANTMALSRSLEDYARTRFKREWRFLKLNERNKASEEWEERRAKAKPTSYDILACMTKYDPGLFEEFCSEFGYDEDSKTADRVYMAVMREYKQLERIFTAKQMEKLREIS